MPLMSIEALQRVARVIRPYITPITTEKGSLSNADLKNLIRIHTGRQIRSDRSLQIIDDFLTGERL